MTEAESREIVDSVKEIIEKEHTVAAPAPASAAPPPISPPHPSIITTTVLENPKEIMDRAKYTTENSNQLSVCSTFGGLQMAQNIIFDSLIQVLNKYKQGQHKGVRWLGCINTKEDVEVVKKFLDLGMQIRHTKDIPLNFSITDKEFNFTLDKMENGKVCSSVLSSNDPRYIAHFSLLFESMWDSGIDANHRIKDIERGLEHYETKVIQNSERIQQLLVHLIKSAKQEILFILPTTNASYRQNKLGVIDLLLNKTKIATIEAAAENSSTNDSSSSVKVRLLTPLSAIIESRLQKYTAKVHEKNSFDYRSTDMTSPEIKATILIIDRKASLAIEVSDDLADNFVDAIGLATYSTSKPTVLSFISIFETLWMQTKLYQLLKESNKQLKLSNEQLHEQGKIQQDFINIAAHELRTPIMPILNGIEMLEESLHHHYTNNKEKKDNNNKNNNKEINQEIIEVIIRNANRLKRLAEVILEVSNIENGTFRLDEKQRVDLQSIIIGIIDDMRKKYINKANRVQILFHYNVDNNNNNNRNVDNNQKNEGLIINCDSNKIDQALFNLVDNAMKFTDDGKVIVSVKKEIEASDKNSDGNIMIVVRVSDTGTGIDSSIKQRLFEKFSSKAKGHGTGLGLYISKNIIEAHGGKMWGENNADGKGATFAFSLPLSK
jgi:two-component system, OmpR family, sensor histidine kinase VicK